MCDKHMLKYLFVIGSAARGDDFSDSSDVDFLYAFDKDKIDFDKYADNYFAFLFQLENLFRRKVDLVPDEKIRNPYFLKQVNSEKIKIYGN